MTTLYRAECAGKTLMREHVLDNGVKTRVPITAYQPENLPILVAVQLADVSNFKDVEAIINKMVVTTVNLTKRAEKSL